MGDAKGSIDLGVTRKTVLDQTLFPHGAPYASFAINDLGYEQHLLSNDDNFVESTSCDIFEITSNGIGQWMRGLGDAELLSHLKVRKAFSVQRFLQFLQAGIQDRSQSNNPLATRILFLTLDPSETNNCKRPAFGCRLSLRKHTTNALLNQLEVRAEFILLLLGEVVVNFLPSTSFETFDGNGQLQKLDFICQQPCWGFGQMQWPVSIWTSLEKRSGMTTCLITAASHDKGIEAVQTRLTSAFDASSRLSAARYNAADPLFVPTLISHECFMQSDSSVFNLGKRLYDSMDIVDAAAETPYDRNMMKSLTFKLHQISQEADFLIHSADTGIALMDSLRLAQERLVYFGGCREKQEHSQSINAADYLKKGIEARKRWLLNAKTRKETAMSLVYNLVSQKEAETNMGIAQDTRNDSSSMKVIAALTMVFLPASAVSSFFGMAFFDGQAGILTVTNEWWMFLAVTVPLTMAVVIIWRLWEFFGHRAPSSSPKRLQDFKTRQTWFRLFTGSPRVDWINGEKGPHEV